MIEIIGLLALSWLLVWYFEKSNLSVLGLTPTKKRITYSLILFFTTAACCSVGYFMRMYFGREEFGLNPKNSFYLVSTSFWLTLKSVLFEELLTRGVGLYILLKKVGQKWAIIISALVFGLLHLNTLQFFNNPIEILLTFLYPFLFGIVLAYSYAKTLSLYLPIAIHLGWNTVENFIFPGNNAIDSILVSMDQPLVSVSYFIFFMLVAFPKIAALLSNYLIVRRIKNGRRFVTHERT